MRWTDPAEKNATNKTSKARVQERKVLVLFAELFETLVNKHERHFYFESLDFDTAFNWVPVPRG
jgi:hypothetical protein